MSNRKHLASNIRFPWNNIMKTVTAISFDFFSCLHPLLCMISNEIGWKRWRVVGNKLASACITHDGAIRPSILILLAYIYKFYFSSFNSYIYILSLCCALSTAVAAGGSEKLLELAAARTTSRQRQKKNSISRHIIHEIVSETRNRSMYVCVLARRVYLDLDMFPYAWKILSERENPLDSISQSHTHTHKQFRYRLSTIRDYLNVEAPTLDITKWHTYVVLYTQLVARLHIHMTGSSMRCYIQFIIVIYSAPLVWNKCSVIKMKTMRAGATAKNDEKDTHRRFADLAEE